MSKRKRWRVPCKVAKKAFDEENPACGISAEFYPKGDDGVLNPHMQDGKPFAVVGVTEQICAMGGENEEGWDNPRHPRAYLSRASVVKLRNRLNLILEVWK